jgi:hypothetical protein
VIRKPAVAGSFYPANASQLKTLVQQCLEQGKSSSATPKAMIVPHAGFIYSGPIAGSAYRTLRPLQSIIHRVILLGPSHRVDFQGIATTSASAFKTPLGEVTIDQQALQQVMPLSQLSTIDEAHLNEHSLEVQLPFLQQILPDFSLLPLVVGRSDAHSIAEVLEQLWGGPETLVLISSDLSHYLPYSEAQKIDQHTSEAILQLNGETIQHKDACGRLPIQGLLKIAAEKGMQVENIDLRNSGDTAGDKGRVVGYGAYLFMEQAA